VKAKNKPSRVRKRNFFVISFSFLIISFFVIFNFFVTPKEIQKIHKIHKLAVHEVLAHPTYWYTKWESTRNLLQESLDQNTLQNIPEILQDISLPMFIAFIHKDLKVPLNQLEAVSLSLKTSCTPPVILLTKEDHSSMWPFQSFISLELSVAITKDHISFSFSRLKKDSQELSTSLSWAYFGSELEPVKRFLSTHLIQKKSSSSSEP
jgi:hypothetical protein